MRSCSHNVPQLASAWVRPIFHNFRFISVNGRGGTPDRSEKRRLSWSILCIYIFSIKFSTASEEAHESGYFSRFDVHVDVGEKKVVPKHIPWENWILHRTGQTSSRWRGILLALNLLMSLSILGPPALLCGLTCKIGHYEWLHKKYGNKPMLVLVLKLD